MFYSFPSGSIENGMKLKGDDDTPKTWRVKFTPLNTSYRRKEALVDELSNFSSRENKAQWKCDFII